MNVDFLHNQIIRDTISDKFIESFNENLVPALLAEYGSALKEVQLYEDHLASGFRVNGEFFYPLTLVTDGAPFTRWIKWKVANYRNYESFNPYINHIQNGNTRQQQRIPIYIAVSQFQGQSPLNRSVVYQP